jgi:hypothetical protein
MWYSSSSGRIDLRITKKQAAYAAHQGRCDDDVRELSQVPGIAKQLKKIDPSDLREELVGYGAWDEVELADHEENLQRFLWLACCSINEEGNDT